MADAEMTFDEFLKVLLRNSSNVVAMLHGTVAEANSLIARNLDKDGLVCHYFSGEMVDYMKADEKHTFIVVPGEWARAIISELGEEFVKGSLATDAEKSEPDFDDKYVRGDHGVVFERSVTSASKIFSNMTSMTCPYRLIRFTRVHSSP